MVVASRTAAALRLWWGLLAGAPCVLAAPPPQPVAEVIVRALDPDRGRIEVDNVASRPVARGSRLLVAQGNRPLALLEWSGEAAGRTVFRGRAPIALPSSLRHLRAWCIRPDALGMLLDRWPNDGALLARLDRVGPAARSVWVHAGTAHGVRPTDSWWLRRNGQPLARLDVRLVERDVCFCGVVPLVAELRLNGDDRVALWPSPGRRVRGRAGSAVAFVEAHGKDQVVWVAVPRNVACPAEPRLEFHRGGRLVASGVAERRDARFWYVRIRRGGESELVEVGDAAVIRTRADLAQRRFVARVFETTAEGCLINAGELDELSAGDTGSAARAGQALGRVVVRRVQRSYAVVRPADETPDIELRVGDEVRFAPPPEPATVVGTIEHVTADTLFAARVASSPSPPLLTPLAVHAGGQTIGVALLVAADGGEAVGFVFERSLTAPLAVGAELILEPAPTP
jgi:hypothetical protein